MNKRGISAIVATVLVILITVAGVAIIWVGVLPMLSEELEFSELDGRVSVVSSGGYTVYDPDRGVASVQIKRDVDEGVMDRIKVSFLIGGDSVSSSVVAPESGGTKVYSFDLSGYGEPDGVEVSPIFVKGNSEKVGSVTSSVGISSGKIFDSDGGVYEIGRDYFYDMPMAGLVSWLKFDDNFDDSVGGIVTEFGGIVTSDGVGVFDGIDDRVFVNDTAGDTNFVLSDSYTVSGWIKKNNLASDLSVTEHWEGSAYPWAIRTNSGISFAIYNGTSGGSNGVSVSGPVYLNNWRHFAAVKDMSQSRLILYVDGGEFMTETAVTISGDTKSTRNGFAVGSRHSTGARYFNGSMDNLMVYNRALSQEEVAAIFENQKKD
jgi:hypothetical protein